jgi:nucleoside triphosphate pyrophosphatase
MKLVLASSSPRRADLLRAAGFSFEILPVHIDERFKKGEKPDKAVTRLAATKASAAAALRHGAIVLAADTSVVVRGQALGKPADPEDAKRMLMLLSGRWHKVLTGICVRADRRRLVHVESTGVRMAKLSKAEIDWYVATGEPADKAGAYAVQGLASRFIVAIEGSYSNVVGLPISRVYNLLKQLGCDILDV